MDDFKLIPQDKIPFRIMKPRAKINYPTSEKGMIIIKFVESNYKIAYIQLDSQRKMELLASNLMGAVSRWGTENIKIRQYKPLLRVYLVKIDQIKKVNYENNLLNKYKLRSTNDLPEGLILYKDRQSWAPIIKKFIKNNYKLAYIEFDDEDELRKVHRGLYNTSRKFLNVKVHLYSFYNRIYLERTDLGIKGEIS